MRLRIALHEALGGNLLVRAVLQQRSNEPSKPVALHPVDSGNPPTLPNLRVPHAARRHRLDPIPVETPHQVHPLGLNLCELSDSRVLHALEELFLPLPRMSDLRFELTLSGVSHRHGGRS